ncbi:MAG: cytochrome c [Betaproteobacteria bacterium]
MSVVDQPTGWGAWLLAAVVTTASAQSVVNGGAGDAERGHALVEQPCNGCHTRMLGDEHRIYTRADRRVRTPAQLRAQIAFCNSQLGAGLFPDEEEHIAAWLDKQYYRFDGQRR